MTYLVSNLQTISDLAYHPWAREDTIQSWLNAREQEGYVLAGVVPGKQPLEDGSASYENTTMLILRKES